MAELDEDSTIENELRSNRFKDVLNTSDVDSINSIVLEKLVCEEHIGLKVPLSQEQMFSIVLFTRTDCYKYVQPGDVKRWKRLTLVLSYAILKLSHAQRYYSKIKQISPSDSLFAFVRTHEHAPTLGDLTSGKVSQIWNLSFMTATTIKDNAVQHRTNKDASLLLEFDLSNGLSDFLLKRSCNVTWISDSTLERKLEVEEDDILICPSTPLTISSCGPDADSYADFHTALCHCSTEQVFGILRQKASPRSRSQRPRPGLSISQSDAKLDTLKRSQTPNAKSSREHSASGKKSFSHSDLKLDSTRRSLRPMGSRSNRKQSVSRSREKSVSKRRLSRSASAIVPSLNDSFTS